MKKCLIVDDVEVSRFTGRVLLEELGVTVVEAENEERAIDKLKEGGVDAVLLDWHLRRKSGLDFIKTIRDLAGSIPIIVFSGVEKEDKSGEALAAGANGYIQKPTTKEKIETEFKKIGIL